MSAMQSINAIFGALTTTITTAADTLNTGVATTGTIAADWATERRITRKARLSDSIEELSVDLVSKKLKREERMEKLSADTSVDFDAIRKEVESRFDFSSL